MPKSKARIKRVRSRAHIGRTVPTPMKSKVRYVDVLVPVLLRIDRGGERAGPRDD